LLSHQSNNSTLSSQSNYAFRARRRSGVPRRLLRLSLSGVVAYAAYVSMARDAT
jgi:hypothetical protein